MMFVKKEKVKNKGPPVIPVNSILLADNIFIFELRE